jgi:hypothetical protein
VDVSLRHEGRPNVPERLKAFRRAVEESGRDPANVPVTLFAWGGESERLLDSYRPLGVERTVFAPPDFSLYSAAATSRRLDDLARYVERH